MADPIALRVLYGFRDRLQAITGGAPYNTEAGQNVFIGAGTVDAESKIPCVVIVEGEETATQTAAGGGQGVAAGQSTKMQIALNVNVEGYLAAAQSNTGEQQAKLKADIKRAVMGPGPIAHSGLTIGPLTYLGAEPFTREDGSNAEGVRVRFVATYTEKWGDPDAKQ